jgi:hypothetical protein
MRQAKPEISDYTALHYLINHESFHPRQGDAPSY